MRRRPYESPGRAARFQRPGAVLQNAYTSATFCCMARWHNIRVRGDLYEMLFHRATSDRRSVAQMTDVLLTGALERETNMPASSGGGPSEEVIPGESGHGAGVGRGARRERDASSLKPAEPASSSARASVQMPQTATSLAEPVKTYDHRDEEHHYGRVEGQMTVDDMLASCPQCAGELRKDVPGVVDGRDVMLEACVDCGWTRSPDG
jgi:hypothetical protein